MNLNNYCPVQASIDRYCAEDEGYAMDNAIERRKDELMRSLDSKDIYDALGDVQEDDDLLKHIASLLREHWHNGGVRLYEVDAIIGGLCSDVQEHIEKLACHQIREEQNDIQRQQWSEPDDH